MEPWSAIVSVPECVNVPAVKVRLLTVMSLEVWMVTLVRLSVNAVNAAEGTKANDTGTAPAPLIVKLLPDTLSPIAPPVWEMAPLIVSVKPPGNKLPADCVNALTVRLDASVRSPEALLRVRLMVPELICAGGNAMDCGPLPVKVISPAPVPVFCKNPLVVTKLPAFMEMVPPPVELVRFSVPCCKSKLPPFKLRVVVPV